MTFLGRGAGRIGSSVLGSGLVGLVFAALALTSESAAAQTTAPPAAAGAPAAASGAPPPYPYAAPPGAYPPPPSGYPPPGGYPPPAYPYPYPYPPPRYAPPPPDPPATATHLGLGYKIGNGLGFLGGDLIVSPAPHVALDLQANKFNVGTTTGKATGYGLAPALQLYLRPPGVSTPYLSVGYVYATVTLDNVRAKVQGGFLNAGYEWKWRNGLAILVGGGASVLGEVSATDGITEIHENGGVHLNIEAGLRYMIF